MSDFGKFVGGLLIGGTIGGILGILLAPRSGVETRQIIAETTSENYKKVEHSVSDAQKKVETSVSEVQKKAEKAIEELQKTGQEVLKKIYDALSNNKSLETEKSSEQ